MKSDATIGAESTDAELLRRYAADRSQDAFAELVRRRVDLVYTVALRQCGGDRHLAEDVTQKVFSDLARKAAELSQRGVLSGWLFRSAQFAASDIVRSERRRRAREQETQAMNEIAHALESPADWEKMRPLLDEALGELGEEDRDAVALRFFEGRAFADIGRALRLTEETARKRVDRALDKLHALLARRGVTSTAAGLGMVLADQIAGAAPAGLAASVTGGVLAGAGTAVGAFWAYLGGTKIALGVAGVVTLAAIGTAVYQAKLAATNRVVAAHATQQWAELQERLRNIDTRLAAETKRAQAAEEDTAQLLAAIAAQRATRIAPPMTASVAAAPAAAEAEASEAEGPIDRAMVTRRYARAQELARSGRGMEALREFLWCLDRGMPAVPSYTGVRLSFLLNSIIGLGEAGRAALVARRDTAEQGLLAGGSREAAQELAAFNRVLKEDERTLAVYDSLPRDDSRRRALANYAYEQLVAARRYADAVQARGYAGMISQFEQHIQERPLPVSVGELGWLREVIRDNAIKSMAKNIEVLAGAGDAANARKLAERLLAYDGSEATKMLLQAHLQRAGHPGFLSVPKP
jgi:RNA polymerase sigma factor (sigma-70 family)